MSACLVNYSLASGCRGHMLYDMLYGLGHMLLDMLYGLGHMLYDMLHGPGHMLYDVHWEPGICYCPRCITRV